MTNLSRPTRSLFATAALAAVCSMACISAFAQSRPYFVKSEIPAGTYSNQTSAVPTVGLIATLTTTASVPEATVYAVVKGVFDNFDEFKRLHPAFSQLDPRRMASEGLSAPAH